MGTAAPSRFIRVAGWAIVPTLVPTPLHVYVRRRDIRFAARSTPPRRGPGLPASRPLSRFDPSVVGSPPAHTSCACTRSLGIDAVTRQFAPNGLVGCQSVTLGGSPIGALDAVTVRPGGTIGISGWAIDPDYYLPIDVHFYVDGGLAAYVKASAVRSDVGAAYPSYGDWHGYDVTIGSLAAGSHTVCAYGIDTGSDSNSLLGCKTIII